MKRVLFALSVMLPILALHCGKNTSTVSPEDNVSPPQNLKALSLTRQAVKLQWTASTQANDTTFKDYLIQWGSKQDSVAKTATSFTADSLSSGITTFTMYSRSKNGSKSSGVSIQWAPAERFPGVFTIYEDRATPAGDVAIDVGTGGGSPTTMPLDINALGKADFYLHGGSGQVQDPLTFNSTDQFQANFKSTYFSTVTHSSSSLDYYLSSFPATSTFTEKTTAVTANTIYYVMLSGTTTDVYFARILVTTVGGSFPGRSAVLQISLQRVVNTPYAEAVRRDREGLSRALLLPIIHSD